MIKYTEMLHFVSRNGVLRPSRPGINTLSVFGAMMRMNLQEGFPLLTTKKMAWKSIVHELLWFISGECTNTEYLNEHGVKIWDANSDHGYTGPIYGFQWRNWRGSPEVDGTVPVIDQLQNVIDGIRKDPYGRRHIVSAWNVAELDEMCLPPCHIMFQFYVGDVFRKGENRTLSCNVYMRSTDIFLGLPFNLASYALLTKMVATVVKMKPGELIFTFGDLHLYVNHLDQAEEQMDRTVYGPPGVLLEERSSIDDFKFEDIKLIGYKHHPAIKAPMAV